MLETILGLLGGSVARVVPEIMNYLNEKEKRKQQEVMNAHELRMVEVNLQADRARHEMNLEQSKVESAFQFDEKILDVMKAGVEAQGKQLEDTGNKWVNFINILNKSVRSVLTYWWCVFMYTGVLITKAVLMYQNGADWLIVLTDLWGPEEQAIVSAIIMFFFTGRVFDKRLRQG